MKIRIDSIPLEGLHLKETRPAKWWTNLPEYLSGERGRFDGPVRVDVRLERISSQISVKGYIEATIVTECARCLAEMKYAVKAPVEVILVFVQSGAESEKYEGYETYKGKEIDLAEHLRGQLALHLPSRFLCRADCRGICPQCGVDLNVGDCSCRGEKLDPRWAELKKLKF